MFDYGNIDDKTIRSEIASRLHDERKKAALTLDQLALELKYSKPTVMNWEKDWDKKTGKNVVPKYEQLKNLAALYNCEIGYLLCEYTAKTKQISDICSEIGILPQAADKLHNIYKEALEHNIESFEIFLSFLCYCINNMDPLIELINEKKKLNMLKTELENDEDKSLIIDGYTVYKNKTEYSTKENPDTIALKGNEYSQKSDFVMLNALKYRYSQKGIDKERATVLANKVLKYHDAISQSKSKTLDFSISDTFLDIVKSYLTNESVDIDFKKFINKHKSHDSKPNPEPSNYGKPDDIEQILISSEQPEDTPQILINPKPSHDGNQSQKQILLTTEPLKDDMSNFKPEIIIDEES